MLSVVDLALATMDVSSYQVVRSAAYMAVPRHLSDQDRTSQSWVWVALGRS